MAERDELAGLPGVWELGWWMLMRPISLHRRLKALGIDPAASAWRLWRAGGVQRAWVGRMSALLFVGTSLLAVSVSLLVGGAGIDVDRFGVAGGAAFGLGTGVALAVGMLEGVANGEVDGVAVGVSVGVALGGIFGVVGGVVLGVVVGVPFGVTVGMAFGVGIFAGHLRLPLYLLELPWQLIAFARQRIAGRETLAWTPVFYHELSYLPLPTLAGHIVDTASRDPALALAALFACAITPGQRRAALRATYILRARELTNLAAGRRFQALRDLNGQWLPDPASADGTFAALQEAGRYLRSAELTLLPDQRREQLVQARDRLRGLDNALLGARGLEPPIYRPAVAAWRRLVDDWLAETEREAALVLPNPFRAGDPLDPEFGREVFRGREGLVAELESILGDPERGGSMALIGARRCGKTSLLKMLPLKLPDAQVIFFDVQGNPIESPAALAEALVRVAQEQARRDRRLALPGLPPGPPMEALRDWIESLEGFAAVRRILICIDEFERWSDLFPGDRRALLQFLGLIRATIQHRRRVRILISGATPLDELEPIWADHFVNLRQLAIGHLTRPVVLDLLTRPRADFPPDAIPPDLAEAIWGRTLGQPYLTQLYGQLIVERLNREGRRQATVADCAAVEPWVLDQAGPPYLSYVVQSMPAAARRALESLARGEPVDLAALDRDSRRYLRRRSLVTESGGLGIPVLGDYLLRDE